MQQKIEKIIRFFIFSTSPMLSTHAQTLASRYLTDTLLHCQQVAWCMRYFAKKLNLTEVEQDYRYTVGLLHDVDRDVIGKNADLHLWDKLEEILKELSLDEVQYIQLLSDIRSHYPSKYPDPQYAASTPVRQYLLAIDELSGLMYAYARMRGWSFDGMEVKGVIKKIKDKSFAAGVDREHVRHCEKYLSVSLEEFVTEMIEAMKSI